MEISEKFRQEIAPFCWSEYQGTASVCLDAGFYLQQVWEDGGFEGSGYDWESVARVFLEEKCPQLMGKFDFDSEAGMFCAYSKDKEALQEFICSFRTACEDQAVMADLLSRAEPD